MKITTKGQNALKLMLDLAAHNDGQPVKLRDIAEREHISEKYLEQIAASLRRASLVRGFKGARGGYVMVDTPEKYTVGSILRAVESDMGPACAETPDSVCGLLWERLRAAENDVLESTTLADLLAWRVENEADFYVI